MENGSKLIEALAKAQLEIKPPKKDKVNPLFKSKYSSLDAIYEACREPLARHGLVLSHSVDMREGKQSLITTLRHSSGEFIECVVPMFVDKVTSQGFGSALTYSRRYAVCSLLSLPSDEDDDGNAATAEGDSSLKKLTAEQANEIKDLIGARPQLLKNILSAHNVRTVEEIVGDFATIKSNILALGQR